jgi:hypothetical protein
MLLDMLPMDTNVARKGGLIDLEVGTYDSLPASLDSAFVGEISGMLSAASYTLSSGSDSTGFRCAPWSRNHSTKGMTPQGVVLLTDFMSRNKANTYKYRDFPPLLHYRNEELGQMLLDCFHPVRSKRYHTRRYKFIRKVKAGGTPSRYITHESVQPDEEELESFDDAPGWVRGVEWSRVGLPAPESLKTSEWTRIKLYPKSLVGPPRKLSEASGLLGMGSDAASNTSAVDSIITPLASRREHSVEVARGEPVPDWKHHDSKLSLPTTGVDEENVSPSRLPPKSPGKLMRLTQRVSAAFERLSVKHELAPPLSTVWFPNPRTIGQGGGGKPIPQRTPYETPVVKGADECEFPCLYNPGGMDGGAKELPASA